MKSTLSGFTLVRNASILDYPFRESVLSALDLCDEYIINCGDSDDDTWDLCETLYQEFPDKIRLISSTWERQSQSGGFQLKSQTDRALNECKGDWLLYVQADEVLNEREHSNIRQAIRKANALEPVDGIVFDYIHFYGDYHHEIRGRNWYRREVRAFKARRQIEAFRDAQGFRKQGKRLIAIPANAHVFHYGYVRSTESLRDKSREMSQWWGEKAPTDPAAFQLKRHVGLSRFRREHPLSMKDRIDNRNPKFDPSLLPRHWDKNELKNAITLIWESVFPYRLGEFRNYELYS
jgi:hypothetical protein